MSAPAGLTGTLLTGILKWDGESVPLCAYDCDTNGRDHTTRCGRLDGHPEDDYGHICADCADLWIAAQP